MSSGMITVEEGLAILLARDSGAPLARPSPQRPMSARAGHERPQSARRVRTRALAGACSDVLWPAFQGSEREAGQESAGATAGGSEHSADPGTTLPPIAGQDGAGLPRARRASESVLLKSEASLGERPRENRASESVLLQQDGAGLRADQVEALESFTVGERAIYAQAFAAAADAELEGVQATIRRRYFASTDTPVHDSPHTFEIVLAGTEPDSSSRDYLTWYYCDFLEAAPVGPAPPFTEHNTTTVEDLVKWLRTFKPRTRTDAYPMLQVAIVALNKIVHKEVQMRNQQAETLIRLNWDLEKRLEAREAKMAELEKTTEEHQTKMAQMQKDVAEFTASMMSFSTGIPSAAPSAAPSATPSAVAAGPNPSAMLEKFKLMKETITIERMRSAHLNEVALGYKRELLDLDVKVKRLERDLESRDKQVKQLQELGKRKELERFSLEQDKKSMQASLHDDKIKSILMNIVKASASSYYTAWKGLYFKSRGRLAQIGNTLQSLAGRRMRQRINTSWQGWWEQTLQHRKSKKVARLVAHNLFTRCLLQWVEDVKMTKVARIVMLVGQKEEGQSDRRRRRAWHEWVLYARHIAKLRKAINMITGNREEKTLGDFLNNWRATAAASILSKAGFGSKAKDKSRPGIRRTGSQGLTGSQAPKIGRTTSPTFGRSSRDVFAPKVGRTISPTFSRTSSFESIHEDNNGDRSDQEDSFKKLSLMPSTSSHSSLQPSSPDGSVKRYASTRNVLGGSAKDVFAENSQGSISSVASPASAFCRAPSNASNASHSSLRSPLRSPLVRRPSAYSASEEQQAFSEDLISSEAFLSTLFRKGSVQAI